MKLCEALDTYLKIDRQPSTNAQYSYVLRAMAAAIGSQRTIRLVTYEDLLDYLATLRRTGRKESTLTGYTSIIKAFFAWCVQRRYLKRSPAADIKRGRLKGRAPAVPPSELRAMVDYARLTSPRNYALMLFMADTGVRVGGLVSLTLDNLDVADLSAWVVEKGGDAVQVFYGAETADALRTWLRLRPPAAHSYVWTGKAPTYEPLSERGVLFIVQRLAAKTNASQKWTPHCIRRAVGHAYAKHRIAPTVTQQKLNHSRIEVTLQHYYPQQDTAYLRDISQRYALIALRSPADEPAAPRLVRRDA